MKNFLLVLFTAIIATVLVACQPQVKTEDTKKSAESASDSELANKKIAVILQQNLGTFSTQYIAGTKEQAEKFGGEATIFTSDGDLAKMATNLDAAINQKFDAILIDHGTDAALGEGVQKAVDAKIPVVVFDSDVAVDGVPVILQGDELMAEMTLDKLAKDFNDEAKIVRIWVAGFAPMDRRKAAYDIFMDEHKGIEEIATFGNVTANTALDTQAQMEAVLKQYPNKGDIDAIWAPFDEFAKGAVRALEQANRTDIKVYGIDMSDEDLQMMQKENSPWVASAAVDPTDIGRIQVRYAYQLLAGEKVDAKITLEPVYIDQKSLPKEVITTQELSKHVEGWGASETGYTDELKALEGK